MKTDLTLAICMYNAEKYIEETLLCIMAQTKQDFFLMIINDCSTDNSADVVTRFFEDHPRQYEMVNLPENRGLAFGRRYVEEHADTEYLLFVDADDCPLQLFVEKLYILTFFNLRFYCIVKLLQFYYILLVICIMLLIKYYHIFLS